jgi:murein DD-endopeptidase MepM/ murein hydrolase activator NlpD
LTLQTLKQQESELLAVILKRENLTERLDSSIRKDFRSGSDSLSEAEAKKQTALFEQKKKRLPMPVQSGVITSHFGKQQHPLLKNITTNNKGISIKTATGADALAVFEGIVAERLTFPGYNNAVIVRHGNYRTVYSNLTDIFVQEGDTVSALQPLGKIFSDKANNNLTELFFLLYKDKELQNPELFLMK